MGRDIQCRLLAPLSISIQQLSHHRHPMDSTTTAGVLPGAFGGEAVSRTLCSRRVAASEPQCNAMAAPAVGAPRKLKIWSRKPCVHGTPFRRCLLCGGGDVCEHKYRRINCAECNGGSVCKHKRRRDACAICSGCEHGKLKRYCGNCPDGGSRLCPKCPCKPARQVKKKGALCKYCIRGVTPPPIGFRPPCVERVERKREFQKKTETGDRILGEWSKPACKLAKSKCETLSLSTPAPVKVPPPKSTTSETKFGRDKGEPISRTRQTCIHGKRRSRCAQCCGSSLCGHHRRRDQCSFCNGVSICIHKKQKYICKICSDCGHGTIKRWCMQCPDGGSYICSNCCVVRVNKKGAKCTTCGGDGGRAARRRPTRPPRIRPTPFCQHGLLRRKCAKCSGCEHGRMRRFCNICSDCGHGRLKTQCIICSDCGHGTLKRWCPKCPDGGRNLCSQCPTEAPTVVQKVGTLCAKCGVPQWKGKIRERAVGFKLLEWSTAGFIKTFTSADKALVGLGLPYRVDFAYDLASHFAGVEVDENEHALRGYAPRCEATRMYRLAAALQKPTVFIRYNPDAFRINNATKRVPRVQRESLLLLVLQSHLQVIPTDFLTIVYICYSQPAVRMHAEIHDYVTTQRFATELEYEQHVGAVYPTDCAAAAGTPWYARGD